MRAHYLRSAMLPAIVAGIGCIPSFSSSDATGGGFYPDFELLDRSEACVLPLPPECLIGAEGCPCTVGGGCDPGLMCEAAVCVLPAGEGDGEGDGDGDEQPQTCGYPAGPYGFNLGDTFENFVLFDCMGNQVQIAQYLPQEGRHDIETRGVVFAIGAVWCTPCFMEGELWAEEFIDDYAWKGIQFIQALDEGANGAAVIPESCRGWSEAVAKDKFPILYVDQIAGLRAKIELAPNESIPITLMFNGNAQITFRQAGLVLPDILTRQIEVLLDDPYGT